MGCCCSNDEPKIIYVQRPVGQPAQAQQGEAGSKTVVQGAPQPRTVVIRQQPQVVYAAAPYGGYGGYGYHHDDAFLMGMALGGGFGHHDGMFYDDHCW
jgi:hypothetical protein